ncbi:MAG TPA: ABC transporter ATP-binding protein [Kofleriaceae bacterium]|nr:ABC transporter ATP-binding protein [Kofleriaceae bacterium]
MAVPAPEPTTLLEIRDLVTEFRTRDGTVRAVDGVSFDIAPRTTLGVVGESGSGKSVTALSIMRLIASPPGRIAGGTIRYAGRDLLALGPAEMRAIRGNRIAMIFQEPMTSLNPVFTVGEQVAEAVRLHQRRSRREARAAAIEMFRRVGIPSPEDRVDSYPHQLSGGMRQRVMIAMALACRPDLLIADEPTTALDVTIQAQILDLLRSLQRELGMSILLITHDLGVVAEVCDEVIVMYAGRIVERARTDALFAAPRHPYTAGLLRSVPSYGEAGEVDEAGEADAAGGRGRLREIPGMVPALGELPHGCKFVDRCPAAAARCRAEEPALVRLDASWVRCHFPIATSGAASGAAPASLTASEVAP